MKRKKLLKKIEKILNDYDNKRTTGNERIASVEILIYHKYGDLLQYEYKNKEIKLENNLGTFF